jgi:hypothetical protein
MPRRHATSRGYKKWAERFNRKRTTENDRDRAARSVSPMGL